MGRDDVWAGQRRRGGVGLGGGGRLDSCVASLASLDDDRLPMITAV